VIEAEAADAARVLAERRAALEEADRTHATLRAQLLKYSRRRLVLQRRLERLHAVGAADRLQIRLDRPGPFAPDGRITGRVTVLATRDAPVPAISVVIAVIGEVGALSRSCCVAVSKGVHGRIASTVHTARVLSRAGHTASRRAAGSHDRTPLRSASPAAA
jgi:hypothetical protein